MISKAKLRERLRGARRALPPDERAARSIAACDHLSASSAFDDAEVIAVYAAHRAEASPADLAQQARAAQKRVAYPRVQGERITFHVTEPTALIPGFAGILEPPADAPEIALASVDVLVVPGLAFDRRGRRLGAGGGFYDRALTAARAGGPLVAVGFGFSCQLVDEVPTEPHDQRMDMLVTDTGTISIVSGE